MIVYNDYVTFKVLDKEVNLITDELYFGRNTVAEVDGKIHYLGNEIANVAAAIFAWQESNGRDLSNEELRQVLFDNNLLSEAI